MQGWLLTGLAIVFFINAFWLIFMGSYADTQTREGKFRTFEFETHPFAFSFSVGFILVLGCTCLQVSNPHFFALAAAKVPQLKILYTVGKMPNGLFYLLGGGFLSLSLIAFVIRRMVTTSSALTKGHDLDIDPRALKAHRARTAADTPDWERDARRKSSQFDDGTPL